MVFSSPNFLFFFLPLLLLFYFLSPKKIKNYVLLLFSLLFYYFGEKNYTLLLIFSCLINYIFGLLISKRQSKKYLVIGLIINILILFYYKYFNFFIDTFNNIFNMNVTFIKVILPLGISFFTFQNISYLIDVYRKDTEVQKNFFLYSTYITLFPQLVAGPIVRYKDINDELKSRKESLNLFCEGVKRFIIGLGKKILIADILYKMCISINDSNMTVLSYILVALMYTFQIYYDFSGYSDMAIGLGKMFGFNFKENFDYPLTSSSITEFWHRWHMSLSSFFRDYIYIPLGGNRVSKIKCIRNILVVWSLTGLWHGADWNFILWGLYFFVLLIIEKYFLKKYLKKGILSHIYTFSLIVISFVIFNISDLNSLATFLKGMIGINTKLISFESIYYLKNSIVILLISILGMGPFIKNKIKGGGLKISKLFNVLEIVYYILIFILSISVTISSSFNPFIYFRF